MSAASETMVTISCESAEAAKALALLQAVSARQPEDVRELLDATGEGAELFTLKQVTATEANEVVFHVGPTKRLRRFLRCHS